MSEFIELMETARNWWHAMDDNAKIAVVGKHFCNKTTDIFDVTQSNLLIYTLYMKEK